RQRVNSRLRIVMRSKQGAIVEESTQIPLAVPGAVFHSGCKQGPLPPPSIRQFRRARIGQIGQGIQHGAKEPSEPRTLAAAFQTYVVQSVIPIAAAKQRKSVSAEARRSIHSPAAVFPQ